MTLYFDGGARPNPGAMELAVVGHGRTHLRDHAGFGDNNTAEWLALLFAVEIAIAAGAQDVLFIGDARTIIDQARGSTPCRNQRFQPYLAKFSAASAAIGRVHLKYVARSKNLAGSFLEVRRNGRFPDHGRGRVTGHADR